MAVKKKRKLRFPLVKYRITDAFGDGDLDVGDVIEAYKIAAEGEQNATLLFHPATKENRVGSLDVCKRGSRGVYESVDTGVFVNLVDADLRVFEALVGSPVEQKVSGKEG